MKHFGVTVRAEESDAFLTRENYVTVSNKSSFGIRMSNSKMYKNEESLEYSDEWCEEHRKNCLANFDLNMKYFQALDHENFEAAVKSFVKKKRFRECHDLNDYRGVEGNYMLVLDRYSQVYIGTTQDIEKRVRQHWTKKKQFDRLLLPIGNITSSIMSIDSFRALDTTRIFVCPTYYANRDEYSLVDSFPREYSLNRIAGGSLMEITMNEVFINPRVRDL